MPVQQQARLIHESEVPGSALAASRLQWLVDQRIGAAHVMAYRLIVNPGETAAHSHAGAEEVLYVVAGIGQIVVEGSTHEVRPGKSVFISDGAEHAYVNTGKDPIVLVGAMAPPMDPKGIRPAMPHLDLRTAARSAGLDERAVGATMMDEQRVAPTLMGERSFRVLASPAVGCRLMTQFTGVIPPGRAPLHAHPHEEAVYILAGHGRLWVEGDVAGPLRPGSVIFIPIGVRHTLENTSEGELLKVLGTFSPAGSPEAKLAPTGKS